MKLKIVNSGLKGLIKSVLGWDPGAVVKNPAWKVGDHGFKPHYGLQVSKRQNVELSSPLTCNDSILWGASVTERLCAWPQTASTGISNPVSGGAVSSHLYHHPQGVLLAQFSLCTQRWPQPPFIWFVVRFISRVNKIIVIGNKMRA